jgi:hypothetical protein
MGTAGKPKLTPTQAKVVKAKIKAELQDLPISAVASEVYPNAKPESARVMVHQNLQNITVQQALEEAMARYGLTADTLAASVGSAMGAYKTIAVEGDLIETEVPDHGIRLKAAGMAANWMGVGRNADGGTTNVNFINVAKNDTSEFGI